MFLCEDIMRWSFFFVFFCKLNICNDTMYNFKSGSYHLLDIMKLIVLRRSTLNMFCSVCLPSVTCLSMSNVNAVRPLPFAWFVFWPSIQLPSAIPDTRHIHCCLVTREGTLINS